MAHALLRAALSSYTDIKPADWQFQTKGMVALALTRVGPVGIDVESTSREQNISEIALDILTSNEYFDLNQQAKTDQHTQLLKYWTLKEAFVKATGLGLTSGLQTFEFDLEAQPQPIIRFLSPKDTLAKNWQFKHCILPSGHILALAHHHPEALHAQVSLNEALWLQETANLG